MRTREAKVKRFRETVEAAISQNIAERRANAPDMSWPHMHASATIGKLTYESVDRDQGRSQTIGHGSEHAWAITQHDIRFGSYAGSLAIVSEVERDDVLYRRLHIDTPMQNIGIFTSRTLERGGEIEVATRWALSPHTQGHLLGSLAVLMPNEVLHVSEEYAIQQSTYEELMQDTLAEERRRRAAMLHMHEVYLD